jgi:hypothetical protein
MHVIEWEVGTEIENNEGKICRIPKVCDVAFKAILTDLLSLIYEEETACNGSSGMQNSLSYYPIIITPNQQGRNVANSEENYAVELIDVLFS